MSDPGLTEATQRVARELGCADREPFMDEQQPWCIKHHRWFEHGHCPVASTLARAAREDVADLIQQARADELEHFAEHHIRNQSPGRIVEDMAARAAAIRDGEA